MRNHEVTAEQPLLNQAGNIGEPGWARRPVWKYNRQQITAPKFRIKEWDYYLVMNDRHGAAFTLSDDGYIGLQSVSFLNFTEKWEHTETILTPCPMGKMKMPASTSAGNTFYKDKRLRMEFRVESGRRMISCDFKNFYDGKDFHLIPAYKPTETVDATGCGDTYMTGYLYCRAKNKSIEEAGRFAAAISTLKIEAMGPFSGTKADIERCIRTAEQTMPVLE